MKFKVLILTILAITAMLIPTAGVLAATQFWQGTAQDITIVGPCAVYSDAECTILIPTSQDFAVPDTYSVGDTYSLTLYVKNTNPSVNYTVTPSVICSTEGAITFTGVVARTVYKNGGITAFPFTATAVSTGTYDVQLTFTHN